MCCSRGVAWKGTTVVKECYSRVCNAESQPCPAQVDGSSTTFVLLGQNSDDQCSQNEGGVLCSGCKVNASFTFEGWSCISSSNCELWHPYVLLVLGLISQLALCMFLLAMLRLKLGFGLGYLYGPVFFLAVVTQLPFRHHTEYSVLRALISIVKSIFFLDLEWLGIIPMCTFDIGKLGNVAFRYIGPVIANLVIIITMVVARKCPKLLAFLQESPVPSICLLLYLSFWSLAETSLTIFYPIFLQTDNIYKFGHGACVLTTRHSILYRCTHIPGYSSNIIGVHSTGPSIHTISHLLTFLSQKIQPHQNHATDGRISVLLQT